MKRLKVLHFTKSEGLYGAERVILNLLDHFAAEQFDVRLATLVEERNPHRELWAEAQRRGHKTFALPCRKRLDRHTVRDLQRLLQEENFDVLHCHEIKSRFYGLWAAKKMSLPLLATNHNWIRKNFMVSALETWDAFALRYFDRVIAVSEEVRDLMVKYGTRPERIALVPNGIPLREFALRRNGKAPQRAALGIAPHERVIGAVGRLSIEKGASDLLAAAPRVLQQHPHTRFLFVGDGPLANDLHEQARALGVAERVTFAGFHSEVAPFYEVMDVFALPSLREGTPMALLEAMAAGVPVVATAVGGVPKIVQHEQNGVLVPAQAAERMATALVQMLAQPERAACFAAQARHTIAENYSAANMARAYEQIYMQLAARRH